MTINMWSWHPYEFNKEEVVDKTFVKTTCIHNYVDVDNKMIRKGAIDASFGELCIIPLNMRDGILLGVGKGNEDWNCSAPHGAGRLMSRSEARKNIVLEDYQESMEGIYSSCITESTIDESVFAYKNSDEIKKAIEPTVDIIAHLKPIWNFKDKGKEK